MNWVGILEKKPWWAELRQRELRKSCETEKGDCGRKNEVRAEKELEESKEKKQRLELAGLQVSGEEEKQEAKRILVWEEDF